LWQQHLLRLSSRSIGLQPAAICSKTAVSRSFPSCPERRGVEDPGAELLLVGTRKGATLTVARQRSSLQRTQMTLQYLAHILILIPYNALIDRRRGNELRGLVEQAVKTSFRQNSTKPTFESSSSGFFTSKASLRV